MPVTSETGVPVATTPEAVATKSPAQLSAEDLHNTLVDMVDQQKSATAAPEVTATPTGVVAPETTAPELGTFEAKGAAVGSRVDVLVDRGSSAVAAGKEKVGDKVDGAALKAYELAGKVDSGIERSKEAYRGAKELLRAKVEHVRERVHGGAELAAEKRAAAVSLTKEKSKEALLVAIGASVVAGEKIAETPENIKNRGRKIADRLNKWCAKAKESFSGMKDNVKDRVASGFASVDAVAGRAAESVVRGGSEFLEGVERRVQDAKRRAQEKAKEAERQEALKILVEASNKANEERINAQYDASVRESEDKHDKVVDAAGKTRDEELAAALEQRDLAMESTEEVTAEKFAGMTTEQIYELLRTVDSVPPIAEPAAESTPETPPVAEATVTPVTPGSTPVTPEAAAA